MTEEAAAPAEVAEQAPARDFETEARAAGWVPEAEFKGERKPAVFVDAETFVKRGEELIPFIRKENKELKHQLDETKADFAKRLERMEKVSAKTFEAQQRAHEAEIAKIKREQRAAVASGDEAEFDRLEKVKDGLEKSAPKAEEPDEKLTPEQVLKAKQDKFCAENPWMDEDKDPDLWDWVVARSQRHGRDQSKTFEQVMELTVADAKKQFPEKFGGKRPGNGQSAVDSGGDFAAAIGGGKADPLAKLPAEARAQAKADMEKFPKIYPSAAAWIKAYNS